ncbi:MAG: hypothetical protein KY395_08270 [Actinobacteria bacterium]|nr:hypothetical protein [Actinomycetota bacterium]
MGPQATLKAIALARTVLGVVALSFPEVPARPWVGRRDAASTGGRVLARALGSRDFALGVGALAAMRIGPPAQKGEQAVICDQAVSWAAMGVVADALDAAVTVAAFRSLPRRGRWQVLAAAGGSAAVGALSLRALRK